MGKKGELGERIKKARDFRGITQAELLSLVNDGLTQSLLFKYESGQTIPRPERLERIASALRVSVQYLHGFEDLPSEISFTRTDDRTEVPEWASLITQRLDNLELLGVYTTSSMKDLSLTLAQSAIEHLIEIAGERDAIPLDEISHFTTLIGLTGVMQQKIEESKAPNPTFQELMQEWGGEKEPSTERSPAEGEKSASKMPPPPPDNIAASKIGSRRTAQTKTGDKTHNG